MWIDKRYQGTCYLRNNETHGRHTESLQSRLGSAIGYIEKGVLEIAGEEWWMLMSRWVM